MSGDVRGPGTRTRTVVTGAAGFIGIHLTNALRHSGKNVVGIDRRDTWTDGELELSPDAGSLRAVHGDLVSMDLKDCLENAEVVFHLAALPGVRPSWTQFPDYLHSNVLATHRLMEACVESGVPRVVIASSSSVYGGAQGAMSEDHLPRPMSPYGVTKLAAERLALAFAERGDAALSVHALRFFTVYGPGQRPDMFISRMIRATLENKPIRIYGDGTQIRDFIHVSDIVRALVLAGTGAVADNGAGDVLNVGTGHSVSVNEVLALTGELTGIRPEARYGAARLGDVGATAADTSRAQRRLGFSAAMNLRAGLADQIEWTRQSLAGTLPPASGTPVKMAPTHGS
ncbi:NAD-dependent epimerase/dehydratase family protein [Streptomyces sp. NPDC002785]|uniref:NAD-dependent epimerase/dehydratase family protein n=1 Tax=Streptomyces sp. NPDC002785 TaxID=3154543 RepID=UPI00331EB764